MADKRIFELVTTTDRTGKFLAVDKVGLPSAEKFDAGALVVATDLDGYVDKTSAQTIDGEKTFVQGVTIQRSEAFLDIRDGADNSQAKIYIKPNDEAVIDLSDGIGGAVTISRNGNELEFKDGVAGVQKLSDLVGGGGNYVTLDTVQQITGAKTFTGGLVSKNYLVEIYGTSNNVVFKFWWELTDESKPFIDLGTGTHRIGVNGNELFLRDGSNIVVNVSDIVLDSDLANYYTKAQIDLGFVTLSTNQNIGGEKTFVNTTHFNGLGLFHNKVGIGVGFTTPTAGGLTIKAPHVSSHGLLELISTSVGSYIYLRSEGGGGSGFFMYDDALYVGQFAYRKASNELALYTGSTNVYALRIDRTNGAVYFDGLQSGAGTGTNVKEVRYNTSTKQLYYVA